MSEGFKNGYKAAGTILKIGVDGFANNLKVSINQDDADAPTPKNKSKSIQLKHNNEKSSVMSEYIDAH